MRKKLQCMAVLWVLILTAAFPMTALAAEQPTAAEVFAGYSITITDATTPATDTQTESDFSTTYFLSADGKRLGSMAYADYKAIMTKYKVTVQLEGGGSMGVTPDGRTAWNGWFADLFNEHRGLAAGSREAAVAIQETDTVERYRQEVLRLVNLEREQRGLTALRIDADVMVYAQTRAQELDASFSHSRPDGKEKPYDELGAIVENIGRGSTTPEAVVEGWMNSPGHRATILSADATATGVGCYWNGAGYYWCQVFQLWD